MAQRMQLGQLVSPARSHGPDSDSSLVERGDKSEIDSEGDASMFEGYECKFVEPPPIQLQIECPVCVEILREPHIVSCCGHSFCQRCIRRILRESHPCPMCRKTRFTIMDNQGLKRALYDFHVRCPQRHVGCDWTGELRNLLTHLNDNRQTPDLKGCPYTKLTCPLCKGKVYREIFKDHQEEQCPQRQYTCEYCKEYRATFEDVTCRHWEVCNQFLLPCPNNCEMSSSGTKLFIERRKLKQHVSDECPLTLVACTLRYAGCTVKLCRKDVTEHMREESLTHLSLLAAENLALVTKLHVKDECVTQLKKVNSELRVCMDEQQEAHVALERNIAALTSDLAKTKKDVCDHQRSIDQQQESHLALERTAIALTFDLVRTKKGVHQRSLDQQQEIHLALKKVTALKSDYLRFHARVAKSTQEEGHRIDKCCSDLTKIGSEHLKFQTQVNTWLNSKVVVATSQSQDLVEKRQQDQKLVRDLSEKVSSQAKELVHLQECLQTVMVEVDDCYCLQQCIDERLHHLTPADSEVRVKSYRELEKTVDALTRELSELRKANTHEKEVQQKALIQEKEARRKAHAQEKDIRCQQLKEVCHKLENQVTLLNVQEKRCEGLAKHVTALRQESAERGATLIRSQSQLRGCDTLENVGREEELAESVSALQQDLAESSTALTQDLFQLREAYTQEKARQEKDFESLAENVSDLLQEMEYIKKVRRIENGVISLGLLFFLFVLFLSIVYNG